MKFFVPFELILLILLALAIGCTKPEATQLEENPAILSIVPQNGATEVPLASRFIVRFNMAMNRESCESNFRVHEGKVEAMEHDGGMAGMHQGDAAPQVTGLFFWNKESTEMTFRPAALLNENTVYTIYLRSGAMKAANGMQMDGAGHSNGMNMGDGEQLLYCSTGPSL